MSTSFKFVQRTTLKNEMVTWGDGTKHGPYYQGKNELLTEVDQIICAYHGIECDDKIDSKPYRILTEWAFAALLNIGGSYIEPRHIDWILEKCSYTPDAKVMFGKFLRWALLQQWQFVAWR